MKTFESITDARNGIMDLRADFPDAIPAHMRDRFRALSASPSPVDQIVNVGELIYANRDQVSNEAKELAAGLISFATTNAWHGLLTDNRGDAIVANLRKDLGEIKSAPDAPDAAYGQRIDPPAPETEAAPQ